MSIYQEEMMRKLPKIGCKIQRIEIYEKPKPPTASDVGNLDENNSGTVTNPSIGATKDTTYYQGRTAPIWWQVVPIIVAGQVNYPP